MAVRNHKKYRTLIKHHAVDIVNEIGREEGRDIGSNRDSKIVLYSLDKTKHLEELEKSRKGCQLEITMDVTQRQKRNLGLNPPIRLNTGRSYAAVVRSPFELKSYSSQAEAESVFNESKSRSTSTETKRTMIDDSTGSNTKKQRMSNIGNQLNQERSRSNQPCADIHTFLRQLDHALESEVMYRGAIQPSASSLGNAFHVHSARTRNTMMGTTGEKITSEMRDGSSHVLRFLKVWYDLPSDVFFGAVSHVDRFLKKMKVSYSNS